MITMADRINYEASSSTSSSPPLGFSLTTNAVTEHAWDEIKLYLGIDTDKRNLGIEAFENFENRGCSSSQLPAKEDVVNVARPNRMNKNQIPWEPTPHPQNRPVAQFGFRYDYERDMVLGPFEDNRQGSDNEQEKNSSDDRSDKSFYQETSSVSVPRIPELFQRLLLDPFYHQQKLGNNHQFTQCIVNVYGPIMDEAQNTDARKDDDDKSPNPASEQHQKQWSSSIFGSHIPWHVDDPRFGPEILVYTFGETRPLHMRLKSTHNSDILSSLCNDTSSITIRKSDYVYYTALPAHCSSYLLSGPARHDWEHSVPAGSGWRLSITFRTLR